MKILYHWEAPHTHTQRLELVNLIVIFSETAPQLSLTLFISLTNEQWQHSALENTYPFILHPPEGLPSSTISTSTTLLRCTEIFYFHWNYFHPFCSIHCCWWFLVTTFMSGKFGIFSTIFKCSSKNTITKMKSQTTKLQKVFTKYISVSRIFKELIWQW